MLGSGDRVAEEYVVVKSWEECSPDVDHCCRGALNRGRLACAGEPLKQRISVEWDTERSDSRRKSGSMRVEAI